VQPLNNVNFSLSVARRCRAMSACSRCRRRSSRSCRSTEAKFRAGEGRDRDRGAFQLPDRRGPPVLGSFDRGCTGRTEQRKVTFSDRDREVIRKHTKARPEERPVERERQTTGSTVRTEIRRGDRLPADVEMETFPEEVYRDAPSLREYRYIHRDSRTYIVEPQERRVIEEQAIRAVKELGRLDRRVVRARFEERFATSRMAKEYDTRYRDLVARGGRLA
jgi:hypothetical protein